LGYAFVNKPYPNKVNKFGVGFFKSPTLERKRKDNNFMW